MSQPAKVITRSPADRVRHSVLFEIGMLLCAVPIGMLVFSASASTIGATAIVLSLIAMVWNYVFNLLFDKGMVALYSHTNKTGAIRIVHAVLFELGLLLVTVPVIAWALQVSLWYAFIADIGFVLFALVYAYSFNLGYDKLFPIPNVQPQAQPQEPA
ncbi:PACE efflux transporter [Paraferrimonas sedimenticola]|uniref:Membrane protein n=1 Tax=Paraferrimonas sedimenticola TaxID=375674 RepID=A0AA37S0G8_9GAMM|nr:PACE efflux transporter [Paraferrimonas sedimenticola]GLP98132.1 membrane protein [Paraferrimonas sedimenticola]